MFGRTSVRFLVSNALSLLGNSIAAVALPLILLATTGDALAAGTLALICAVPQMAIGIVGGAALDRFNRRTISIASDLVSAASIALIPIVDMIWGLNFWWFVALGLLGAVGDIPGMTARDALLPAVTKHDDVDLQRFMGLSQSLDSLVTIVGPALAALSIGLVGGLGWRKLSHLRTGNRPWCSVMEAHFVGSMVINSLALHIFYGYAWAVLIARIPNALVLTAVNTVLLRILLENRALMAMAKR